MNFHEFLIFSEFCDFCEFWYFCLICTIFCTRRKMHHQESKNHETTALHSLNIIKKSDKDIVKNSPKKFIKIEFFWKKCTKQREIILVFGHYTSQCLKITQKVAFSIFQFWDFPPMFVLLKLTCLVTLFDRKFQIFKKSLKLTVFGIFD